MSTFNFQEMKDQQDRSFTMRLVDEIAQGRLDEVGKITGALSELDDPRSLAPLTNILLDLNQSKEIRRAASDALCNCSTLDTADQRRDWWQSDDPVLMRHAIRVAKRSETELVVMVASDPNHEFYIDAMHTLEFWEEPRFQNLIIPALTHKQPDVRKVAGGALLWEQPVAAESMLLRLAGDASHKDVALKALTTLCYCASQEILLTLDDLSHHGPEELRDDYKATFGYAAEEFSTELHGRWESDEAKSHFLDWLAPVKHLIALEEIEKSESADVCSEDLKDENPPAKRQEPKKFEFSAEAIIDDLSEADGKWCEKSNRYWSAEIWEQIKPSQRQGLSKFLREHYDPVVREIACRASADWQDRDAILELMNDSVFNGRKTASAVSRRLQPSKQIADRLRELIACEETSGSFAIEALESYLVHATNINQKHFLTDLAMTDARSSIKQTAIRTLNVMDAKGEVERLIPLLSEDPFNTWCVHIAILDACLRMSILLPPLDHLQSVDNLWLQSTLAEVAAAAQS